MVGREDDVLIEEVTQQNQVESFNIVKGTTDPRVSALTKVEI